MHGIQESYFSQWKTVLDFNELQRLTPIIINLYQTAEICPMIQDIFKAFNLCEYQNLKAVFLGMDPYPQRGVATGILFGNKPDTRNISPSLEIIREAVIDYSCPTDSKNFDITLESWCRQGVLMLNSALTVECNKPGSHTLLWRQFISKLLINLSIYQPGLPYVLFGKTAQTFTRYINKEQNLVIEAQHPAYLARNGGKLDSRIFEDVNIFITKHNGEPIEWFTET